MGEAAFLARGGIAVQDALGGDAVDYRLRFDQCGGGGLLVARGDRFLHVLDRAARVGAQAHVAAAQPDCLARPFACGFDVCHVFVPASKKARILA